MVGTIFLAFYFSCLASFLFLSHPVLCCLLLLISSLTVCGYLFLCIGFSWYVCLFCLVYVGGVYILFIFVSVCVPNVGVSAGVNWVTLVSLLSSFVLFFVGVDYPSRWVGDSSFYLCSYSEGFLYCVFCVMMLVGLVIVSSVASRKGGYYR